MAEHFQRQSDNKWLLTTVQELEDSLYIASIDCHLKLSEVYDRVSFPEPETVSEVEEATTEH